MGERTDGLDVRYVSLSTRRRSGTEVSTPVLFVAEGNRVFIWTSVLSGKARRIRANSEVTVAPCDMRGEVTGPSVAGVAKVLGSDASQHAARLFSQKYGPTLALFKHVHGAWRRLGRGQEWIYLSIELRSGAVSAQG